MLNEYTQDVVRRSVDIGGLGPDHLPQLSASAFLPGNRLLPGDYEIVERARVGEELSTGEEMRLEAVIWPDGLRPAFDVADDAFLPLPPGWDYINQNAAFIERCIRSVGRVEIEGDTEANYAGSAFVVGSNAVLTNRHVAEAIAVGVGVNLSFLPARPPVVDFKHEIGSAVKLRAKVVDKPIVSEMWDAAILKLDQLPVGASPLPLAGSAPEVIKDRKAVVIGYPALDMRANVYELAQAIKIFKTFRFKRLQPGFLVGFEPRSSYGREIKALTHDCTTMGGNSGSPVVDVERLCVTGLHFEGIYKTANFAVPTWDLLPGFLEKTEGLDICH